MTPFDVVKIRLQAQQKTQLSNKCFLYCNGLMDHLCPCINPNGPGQPSSQASQFWYHRTGHFTGTMVSKIFCLWYIYLFQLKFYVHFIQKATAINIISVTFKLHLKKAVMQAGLAVFVMPQLDLNLRPLTLLINLKCNCQSFLPF